MRTDWISVRRDWLAAQSPLEASHVGHDVLARLAAPEEIPEGARRIIRVAEAAGWDVVVTYAHALHARVGDNIMVSMRQNATERLVVGVWLGDTFDFGYTEYGIVNGRGLRAALAGVDNVEVAA